MMTLTVEMPLRSVLQTQISVAYIIITINKMMNRLMHTQKQALEVLLNLLQSQTWEYQI